MPRIFLSVCFHNLVALFDCEVAGIGNLVAGIGQKVAPGDWRVCLYCLVLIVMVMVVKHYYVIFNTLTCVL